MIRTSDIVHRDEINNRGLGTLPRGESATGMFPSRLGEFEMSADEPSRSILSMAKQSGFRAQGVVVQSLDGLNRDEMSNSQLSVLHGRLKPQPGLASSSTRQQDRMAQNGKMLRLLQRQPLVQNRAF